MKYGEWKERFVYGKGDNTRVLENRISGNNRKYAYLMPVDNVNRKLHTYGDYLYDKLGAAIDNNKDEFDEIVKAVKEKGGEDNDMFWEREFNGYMEEYRLAKSLGYRDTAKEILQEMRARKNEIYGK